MVGGRNSSKQPSCSSQGSSSSCSSPSSSSSSSSFCRRHRLWEVVVIVTCLFDAVLQRVIQKVRESKSDRMMERKEASEMMTMISSRNPFNRTIDGSSPPVYYLHIPKCGGSGTFRRIREDLEDPDMVVPLLSSQGTEGRIGPRLGEYGGKIRSLVGCNHGFQSIELWDNWTTDYPLCPFHMTEGPYSPSMNFTMTMIREPIPHVLSQFFHCMESRDHAVMKHRMPNNLTEWLETWVGIQRREVNPAIARHFRCYNPIDMQSRKLDHPSNLDELSQRVNLVGLLSEFHRSTCLMSIYVSGVVPSRCNCTDPSSSSSSSETTRRTSTMMTNSSNSSSNNNSSSNSSNSSSSNGNPTKGYGEEKQPRRHQPRRQELKWMTHGVAHHGDSFHPTTRQVEAIKSLTERDKKLYENAERLFAQHVKDVQETYDFVLC